MSQKHGHADCRPIRRGSIQGLEGGVRVKQAAGCSAASGVPRDPVDATSGGQRS